MCNQKINIGDEIVRIASGIWVHNYCEEKLEPANQNTELNINKKLLDSKADRLKSLRCVYCSGVSFLKSKVETVALDDGSIITKKLYPCYTCGHIMEFVENISS
jgi:DNA-directed RNA polymerase subunit RPC12/RpoP